MNDFDYYYGLEAEQFTFYRIPRLLIKDERFRGLSSDAKLLYGLMLDRMSLSIKNAWLDEENKAYIIYPVNDVIADLACGKERAIKVLAELDSTKGIGLIERVRRGLGKSDIIYVKKLFSGTDSSENIDSYPDDKEADLQKSENQTSEVGRSDLRGRENRLQEVEKTDPSYIDINKTDINYININNNNITPKSEDFEEQATGQARLDYERIVDMYNSTCKDLPKVRGLSDERRRKIRTLLGNLNRAKLLTELDDYEKLQHIFNLANESNFLSGRESSNGWCSFDWLIQTKNAIKVIEGNYKNKGERYGGAVNQAGASNADGTYTSESENEALAAFRAGRTGRGDMS